MKITTFIITRIQIIFFTLELDFISKVYFLQKYLKSKLNLKKNTAFNYLLAATALLYVISIL